MKDKTNSGDNLEEIRKIVDRFFDLFTNLGEREPQVEGIREIFLPSGILINNTAGNSESFNLDEFISPRAAILSDGTLKAFSEREVSSETQVFGKIAQRISHYEKSGVMNNEPFEGKGVKLMQFVKYQGQWKMTSVLWQDE